MDTFCVRLGLRLFASPNARSAKFIRLGCRLRLLKCHRRWRSIGIPKIRETRRRFNNGIARARRGGIFLRLNPPSLKVPRPARRRVHAQQYSLLPVENETPGVRQHEPLQQCADQRANKKVNQSLH